MQGFREEISNTKVKQIFMLGLISVLCAVIVFYLKDFIPSFLGALTLYIVCRNHYFSLVEKRKWKSWLAALYIIGITLIVLVLPVYFIIESLIYKAIEAKDYLHQFNVFIQKIHDYLYRETNVDLFSQKNIEKIGALVTQSSSILVNTTLNTIASIAATYFILYFMFVNARSFEQYLVEISPLKRINMSKIGKKVRSMVVANAVGIPVVAFGQASAALVGYFIFGAPNPFFLFALTFVGSMLPIVGSAVVYVPVTVFMLAIGQTGSAIGLLLYGVLVVGLVDNIFRFTILKKLDDIHPLNTVFGIILGLKIFGFIGLIFGPILISMLGLLIRIYRDEFLKPKKSNGT